jgi:hypothetical protein
MPYARTYPRRRRRIYARRYRRRSHRSTGLGLIVAAAVVLILIALIAPH